METGSTSGTAAVGRMVWMMIGPAVLFLLTVGIARDGGGWFTLKDLAFAVVLGAVILGRVLEFRSGDPRTAAGEPATRDQLRRYVVGTLAVGGAVWTIANLIGNRSL